MEEVVSARHPHAEPAAVHPLLVLGLVGAPLVVALWLFATLTIIAFAAAAHEEPRLCTCVCEGAR
jgi:hypothetical protein